MAQRDKLLVCGAGGHAKSVIDMELQNDTFDVVGCVDTEFPKVSFVSLSKEIPVIGTDDDLYDYYEKGIRKIFIALGNNYIRKKVFEYTQRIGFEAVNIISRHAVVSPSAKLGKGICIMPGSIINACARIGDGCILNTNCSVDHDDDIGAFCHIAPGVTICGCVAIGNTCFIGAGARIIDNITIGDNVILGAGATAIRNIPSGHTAVGVPAKIIK